MSSIRIEPIRRGPMKANHHRVPRNLPPIKSVSPPLTPPPEFDDRPSTPRSSGRMGTPAPQSSRFGLNPATSSRFGNTPPTSARIGLSPAPASARNTLGPIKTPEIHSGRVLHERGMPLLCKVRLKTLKEMKDRLKEWLPLTSERVDNLAESKVIDGIAASSFKRTKDAVVRWDMLIAEMDTNYETIAHVWNYVIQHVSETDKKILQTKFNTTVNKRFNVMLEPLQLNRRRQENVGDLMMTAVQQTQADMESLSVELKTYKEFTAKINQLTGGRESDEAYAHDIGAVYDRLSSHIVDLEREADFANVELKKMKEESHILMTELKCMKDKNSELQSQIEYFQQMTMANAQLQAKNTELQDAIIDLKKDIAMGQSLMMQEIRAMREENRVRAEEEHEKIMEEFQDKMNNAMTESSTSIAGNSPQEKRVGHTHSKRTCAGKK